MMGSSSKQHKFEYLLGQFTEDALSAAEREQLCAILETDRGLRWRYMEHCQMHALLRSEHGLLTAWSAVASENEAAEGTKRLARSGRQTTALLAAAALVVIAISSQWLDSPVARPHRGEELAELTQAVGAEFVYGVAGEVQAQQGTQMRAGLYTLQAGLVEIEYPSGAVLVMQAPATFELVSAECLRLEDGRLSAHIPETATGFRIDSPGATVIDVGTDFAVQAIRDQESEVHVFNGEVLIDLHGNKWKSTDLVRLVTGEATRVAYSTGMPSGIDLDSQYFLRSLRVADSAYVQQVLALKPAVYYRMEPTGNGAQLIDSAASGAHATIQIGLATAPVWTVGKVGAALQLGGTAQQSYAVAQHYPQTDGDQLSVAGWIYARSRPRWASIAKNWAGGNYDRGQFHFGLREDSGELEAHIVDNRGDEIAVQDTMPLPLNTWHHVAFVADGQILRLYRNGREIDARPYDRLHRDPRIRALAIGTKLNLSGDAPEERDYNMWDGRLDELAIFNHALTADDVRALYEAAELAK